MVFDCIASLLENAAYLVDLEELIRRDVGEVLSCAAWPLNVDRLDDGVLSETERESQVALGAVTAAGTNGVPLFS
jgi:hypothetical protein